MSPATRVGLQLILILLSMPAFGQGEARAQDPELLTEAELSRLRESNPVPDLLNVKLVRLLTIPFVRNEAFNRGVRPIKPEFDGLGKGLRVVVWNIERGANYDAIKAVLGDPKEFSALIDDDRYPAGGEARARLLRDVEMLKQADVILLSEADWGMTRSGYRHVAEDLASDLDMNYAFGVEFVYPGPESEEREDEIGEEIIPERVRTSKSPAGNESRYRGLHGNAILSRYRLENVRIISLGSHERSSGTLQVPAGQTSLTPEQIETASTIQHVGGYKWGVRMALAADLVDPDLPGGRVTVISTHLDARTKPENRTKQLGQLLSRIKHISHPVVLGGDMNTSALDATPRSAWQRVRREASTRRFWLTRGLAYLTGLGFLLDATQALIRYGRTLADPTVRSIPLIAPNPGAGFFRVLRDFRFDDGGSFDFRGDRDRSVGERSATLANSNQRAPKGFVTTFELSRTLAGVGRFKLDWIFIKPATLTAPRSRNDSYLFAPHFGRTLKELNYSVKGRISDHDPLTVDLPFGEPRRP